MVVHKRTKIPFQANATTPIPMSFDSSAVRALEASSSSQVETEPGKETIPLLTKPVGDSVVPSAEAGGNPAPSTPISAFAQGRKPARPASTKGEARKAKIDALVSSLLHQKVEVEPEEGVKVHRKAVRIPLDRLDNIYALAGGSRDVARLVRESCTRLVDQMVAGGAEQVAGLLQRGASRFRSAIREATAAQVGIRQLNIGLSQTDMDDVNRLATAAGLTPPAAIEVVAFLLADSQQ